MFLGAGSVGNIFIGYSENNQVADIVGKVAENKRSQEMLRHEAKIYAVLSTLQGSAVPTVYGLFTDSCLHILLMK
jgi:predicted Ser/Thr protein kinase